MPGKILSGKRSKTAGIQPEFHKMIRKRKVHIIHQLGGIDENQAGGTLHERNYTGYQMARAFGEPAETSRGNYRITGTGKIFEVLQGSQIEKSQEPASNPSVLVSTNSFECVSAARARR